MVLERFLQVAHCLWTAAEGLPIQPEAARFLWLTPEFSGSRAPAAGQLSLRWGSTGKGFPKKSEFFFHMGADEASETLMILENT